MKKITTLLIFIFLSIGINAQSIIGAWETFYTSENGEQHKRVAIFSDGFQVHTTYNSLTGEFIHSKGGSWKLEGSTLMETLEFDTDQPELIGKAFNSKISISDSTYNNIDQQMQFKRIDSGAPGKLQGAWLMSGRIKEGETLLRNTDVPRKTMKIMSGTRFQWIAYNTETKQFMGTGGGTYATDDHKYTEHIEFFSRDITRVGASLEFNYNIIEGNWHHSGLSSKGEPIHEIWSTRKL